MMVGWNIFAATEKKRKRNKTRMKSKWLWLCHNNNNNTVLTNKQTNEIQTTWSAYSIILPHISTLKHQGRLPNLLSAVEIMLVNITGTSIPLCDNGLIWLSSLWLGSVWGISLSWVRDKRWTCHMLGNPLSWVIVDGLLIDYDKNTILGGRGGGVGQSTKIEMLK